MDPEELVTSEAQGRRIRQAGYIPPRPVPEPPKADVRPVATPDGICRVIVCEICREKIARVWESVGPLTYPMSGGMFQGLAGPVGPWHQSLGWIDIRCPVCHNRPFILPDRVITVDGPYDLPIREGADVARCHCGRPLLAPNGGKPVCRYHGAVEPWTPPPAGSLICPVCGRQCKTKMGYEAHTEACRRKENT